MSRRYNCSCGKKRYRDEESALAAARADEERYGGEVAVYRCPGGLAWHLSANGFVPQALRSAGRRLAHELLTEGEADVADPRRRRAAERMAALGLAEAAGPDRLRAVNRPGLTRVVQVGLDAYQSGVSDGGRSTELRISDMLR